MKSLKKWLIAGGILSIPLAAAITTPIIVSIQNKKTSTPNVNDSQFRENLSEYNKYILEPKLKSFDFETSAPNFSKYNKIPLDPNNEIYSNTFKQINENIIKSDVIKFLINMKNYPLNKVFLFNISNLSIQKNDDENIVIKLDFILYNSSNSNNAFVFNNYIESKHNLVNFIKKEIKNCSLEINSKIIKHFYKQDNNNISNLFFGYKFNKASLNIGESKIDIDNFYFSNYSTSFNNVIKNVNDSRNYREIKDEVLPYLKSMTVNDFIEDIKNNIKVEQDYVLKILDPSQSILQALAKNEPTNIFLKSIANDVQKIIDASTEKFNPNLTGLGYILSQVITDKKLYELLSDELFRDGIIKVLNSINPSAANVVEGILSNLSFKTENEFNNAFDNFINSGLVASFIPEELKTILDQVKEKGFLSFIIENLEKLSPFISLLLPNSDILESLSPIFKIISTSGMNIRIIDLIIQIVKLEKLNNEVTSEPVKLLQSILSPIIKNKTILKLLSELLFNNPNLNSENLIAAIDAIANPCDLKGNVIRYLDWYKSLKIVETISTSKYDNKSLNLNLEMEKKYIVTKDLKINVNKIFPLIPDDFKIGTTNFKTIRPFLNNVTILISPYNDNQSYFSYKYVIDDNVDYATKLINGNQYLNWKTIASVYYDVNLPTVLKNLYDNSTIHLEGTTLVNFAKGIFYNIFKQKMYYSPSYSKKLSPIQIMNYDPQQKSGDELIQNKLTTEKIEQIKNLINQNTKLNEIEGTKFNVGQSFFWGTFSINKTFTWNSTDITPIIEELFDTTNYTGKLKYFLNSNVLVNSFKAAVVDVPSIIKNNISVYSPYETFSNDGKMKSEWIFEL